MHLQAPTVTMDDAVGSGVGVGTEDLVDADAAPEGAGDPPAGLVPVQLNEVVEQDDLPWVVRLDGEAHAAVAATADPLDPQLPGGNVPGADAPRGQVVLRRPEAVAAVD